MIEAFLKFFVVFFVVVSPISILPEFASLTEGATSAYKKRMAIKATGGKGNPKLVTKLVKKKLA